MVLSFLARLDPLPQGSSSGHRTLALGCIPFGRLARRTLLDIYEPSLYTRHAHYKQLNSLAVTPSLALGVGIL